MIYLGSDHGGYGLKEKIKKFLREESCKFRDLGNLVFDRGDDYPDFAFAVAEKIGKEDDSRKKWAERAKGILFCRSSGGMIIAANKVKNVRAVAVFDDMSARHAREHNDANVIALSGDWTDEREAEKIVSAFLETEFSGEERHRRRLDKIRGYEERT